MTAALRFGLCPGCLLSRTLDPVDDGLCASCRRLQRRHDAPYCGACGLAYDGAAGHACDRPGGPPRFCTRDGFWLDTHKAHVA